MWLDSKSCLLLKVASLSQDEDNKQVSVQLLGSPSVRLQHSDCPGSCSVLNSLPKLNTTSSEVSRATGRISRSSSRADEMGDALGLIQIVYIDP